MSFAQKCHPARFDEVIGQSTAVAYLAENAQRQDPCSVVVFGPRGCGKASLANIYARSLLCSHTQDPPCSMDALCVNCEQFLLRQHLNCLIFGETEMDEARFLETVRHAVRFESLGNGRLVTMIPRAKQFSPAGYEALRAVLKRPPANSVFIICAGDRDEVPPGVDDLLQPVPLVPPPVADRMKFARRVCEKTGTEAEEAALELIAVHAGPNLCRIARDIETVARLGSITVSSVRHVLFNTRMTPAFLYIKSVVDGRPFDEQFKLLEACGESPTQWAEAIDSALGWLLRTQILHQTEGDTSVGMLAEPDAASLIQGLIQKADQNARSVRSMWGSLLAPWRFTPSPTDSMILYAAWEFDAVVNSSSQVENGVRRSRILGKYLRSSTPVQSPVVSSTRAQKEATQLSAYLTGKQVEAIWDAASFLHQQYGLLLNTRMTLRYDRLGVQDPNRIGPFLSDLTRQLDAMVERAFGPDRFHWLYVHENVPAVGPSTHLICHIPGEAGRVDKWVRESFLAQRCSGEVEGLGFTMRFNQEGEPGLDLNWRRHFALVRLLCRGAHPDLPAGSGSHGQSDRLIDRLKIPPRLRHAVGVRFGAQRYGVSESLSRGARRTAGALHLPMRSALQERRWEDLTTKWEASEYEYRIAIQKRYQEELARVRDEWGAQSDKEAAFRREWIHRIGQRAKSRPDWPRFVK